MNNKIDLIIVFLLILLIAYLFFPKNNMIKKYIIKNENFYSDLLDYSNYPIWNIPTRSTRNMSYDLRGDVPIGSYYYSPWLQGTRRPIINKPLWMVS